MHYRLLERLILRPAVIDRRAFVGNARKLLPRTYITVIIGKSGIFDLAHTLFESLDLFLKQLDSFAFLHSITSFIVSKIFLDFCSFLWYNHLGKEVIIWKYRMNVWLTN